jgi:hypothetical protein
MRVRLQWLAAMLASACGDSDSSGSGGAPPGAQCAEDLDCADDQRCRDEVCEGCGDDRVQAGELCFGAPNEIMTLGATELLLLDEPGSSSVLATLAHDPRIRRLRGTPGPGLTEEWFLAELTVWRTLVADLDADGWDDVTIEPATTNGSRRAFIDADGLQFELDYAGGPDHPRAFMPAFDGLPARIFDIDADGVLVWYSFEQGYARGPTLELEGVESTAIGDIDGDGAAELVVATFDGRILRFVPEGPSFEPTDEIDIGFEADILRVGDLDADGRGEVIATQEFGDALAVVRATPAEGLVVVATLARSSSSTDPAIADLDHDGRADVLLTSSVEDHLFVISLAEDDTLVERHIALPGGAATARPFDLDDDGLLDIVAARNDRLVIIPGGA